MRSNDIKNLCVAIEALSRVPGYNTESCKDRIGDLLDDLLKEEETQPPAPTPKPTPNPNDDIPF